MTKTLLAVEDSATMRKVLEITFGGDDDYQVVTAESKDKALAQLGSKPSVVLIDAALGGGDGGYELAKEVRQRDGGAVVILLSSRHNPYDPAKGKDSGADDFMDKPFDTQQMIDKVKKAVSARASGGGAQAVASPAPVPAAAAAAPTAAPVAAAKPAAGPFGAPAATPAATKSRSATLMFGGELGVPPPRNASPAVAAAAPAATTSPARPAPKPTAELTATAQSTQHSPVAAAVNGHMSAKLGELGLSKEQAEAVLALSRDIVERVVWEVVPQLAEVLIKEEIARLTKE